MEAVAEGMTIGIPVVAARSNGLPFRMSVKPLRPPGVAFSTLENRLQNVPLSCRYLRQAITDFRLSCRSLFVASPAIPSMPEHASFISSYRQVTGGTAEAAGVSATITVSVVDFSPLTPGATYQL